MWKQVVSTLVSIYFGSLQLGHTIKTNCIKFQTVDPKIFLILNFRNGPGTSFFTKFICIVIICFPVCDVINFENNISLLNKLFFFMTKKSWQKFYYLKNEKIFEGKIKNIFIIFKRVFICEKLPQTWELTFRNRFSQNKVVLWKYMGVDFQNQQVQLKKAFKKYKDVARIKNLI